MLKKSLSLMIACLLVGTVMCVQPASASSKNEKQARFAEKVKAGLFKLGSGKDALVEVKLRDKTKLTGYVEQVSEDHFVITNAKTGESSMVAYGNVAQVKGHNLSTGAKVAIGIGIGVGIALIILAIYINCCTG
jgi:hypothetical protein